MIINELSPERLSLIFAHYAYRDIDIVENLHAGNSAVMDAAVYETVYGAVAKKIRAIKRNHHILTDLRDEDDLRNKLESMNGTRPVELVRYCMSMTGYATFPPGSEWDTPVLLDGETSDDLATYVLSGTFAECCRCHRVMDDICMCYINRDVYNRFYTLVCKGLL